MFFKLIIAYWRHIAKLMRTSVNIGSGNGLLPDGSKPLPGPMSANHHWGFVAFTWYVVLSTDSTSPRYILANGRHVDGIFKMRSCKESVSNNH